VSSAGDPNRQLGGVGRLCTVSLDSGSSSATGSIMCRSPARRDVHGKQRLGHAARGLGGEGVGLFGDEALEVGDGDDGARAGDVSLGSL